MEAVAQYPARRYTSDWVINDLQREKHTYIESDFGLSAIENTQVNIETWKNHLLPAEVLPFVLTYRCSASSFSQFFSLNRIASMNPEPSIQRTEKLQVTTIPEPDGARQIDSHGNHGNWRRPNVALTHLSVYNTGMEMVKLAMPALIVR